MLARRNWITIRISSTSEEIDRKVSPDRFTISQAAVAAVKTANETHRHFHSIKSAAGSHRKLQISLSFQKIIKKVKKWGKK